MRNTERGHDWNPIYPEPPIAMAKPTRPTAVQRANLAFTATSSDAYDQAQRTPPRYGAVDSDVQTSPCRPGEARPSILLFVDGRAVAAKGNGVPVPVWSRRNSIFDCAHLDIQSLKCNPRFAKFERLSTSIATLLDLGQRCLRQLVELISPVNKCNRLVDQLPIIIPIFIDPI